MHKPAHTWMAALLLLGNALAASEITNLQRVGSNLNFNLVCDRYAEYLIQRSTNLTQWETLRRSFGPGTNRAFQIPGSNDPAQPKAFFRAMQTNEAIAGRGLVAKETIVFCGSGSDWPWIDSYDSSDPNYSSSTTTNNFYPGGYDPLKRKDTAFVASLSSATNAIDTGGGEILGSAATAPGGLVLGTVGDGAWCTTMTGTQPGHVRDDFDLVIPDAALPSVTWVAAPPNYVLGNDNYKVTGDLTTSVNVVGKARLWVTGNVRIRGGDTITINNGRSLEIFLGTTTGTNVTADFGGNGIVNYAITNCTILGLPTCTSIKYSGGVDMVARIYAPQADVVFRGAVSAYSAFTANSFSLSGSSGIHIDEALAK
jgi:hypothetical protein